ncbi:DNA-directed RNA polymerase III complex subunit Rpc25, partial [Conglomerata obtusa]
MFVILTVEDKIQIHPKTENLGADTLISLNSKYSNKIIDKDLAISVKNIITKYPTQIKDGYLLSNCRFELITFKFITSEVLIGRISRQDESGIKVTLPFFENIYIKHGELMENCELLNVKIDGKCFVNWVWNYENEKYYFRNDEKVRFRILNVEDDPLKVYGSFDGVGL